MAISIGSIGEGADTVHFSPAGLMYYNVRHRFGSRTQEEAFLDGSSRIEQRGPRVPGITVLGIMTGKGSRRPGTQEVSHAALTALIDGLRPLVGGIHAVSFIRNAFYESRRAMYSVDSLDIEGSDYNDMAPQTITWTLQLSFSSDITTAPDMGGNTVIQAPDADTSSGFLPGVEG